MLGACAGVALFSSVPQAAATFQCPPFRGSHSLWAAMGSPCCPGRRPGALVREPSIFGNSSVMGRKENQCQIALGVEEAGHGMGTETRSCEVYVMRRD